MTNPDIRAALLALALVPMPALATEPKNQACIIVPPRPALCTVGPAGPGFPEGAVALRCGPVLPQAEGVKP